MRPIIRSFSSPTSPRKALIVCPCYPSGNLPFYSVQSTFSSPCSRSNTPSLVKARFSLTLIWTDGSVSFPTKLYFEIFQAKAALAYLPTALFVAPRPLFPFWQALYVQVFPLKSTPFRKLSAGLGSTKKSAISLFFFSDSRSVLTTLSSSPSFFFLQTF